MPALQNTSKLAKDVKRGKMTDLNQPKSTLQSVWTPQNIWLWKENGSLHD